MTYIPFHTAGRPVCAQKKEWGFKNVSNKFKSIKSKKKKKKKEDGASQKKTEYETENELPWKKEK